MHSPPTLLLLLLEVQALSSPARKASSPIDPRSPSLGLVWTSTTGSANPDNGTTLTRYRVTPQDWSRAGSIEAPEQTLLVGKKSFQTVHVVLL